jgi:hypothetical protein
LKRDAETGELIYEVEPDIDDEYNEESVEDDEDTIPVVYNDYMYGSLIHFKLNGNELEIVDEGYNGRELTETIRLEQENVFYQVDFSNTNTDLMEEDIIHFLDFEVLEPYLTSDFGNAYSGMYVSSLPIRGKTVLFTRESEEGTIYYLKDDGTDNFTYIQEPFYMYYCGVDLKAEETIHLFNLNNSYRIFYLQNGLVRLGFERIEGRLFLAKYDPYTRKYINVAVLQLEHYSNFEVKDYSDDKISVKADDITFTMYRGHPYVVINHKEEDINIKTIFNMIWGESVNNLQYDFPMFFELENNQNQLPACVGGNDLISSCVTIDDPINEDVGQTPTLTLTKNTNTVYNGEYCYFTVNGNVTDVDEEIPFEGTYDGVFGKYTIEGGNSSSPSVEFTSQQTTTYVNQRVNPQVILLDKSGDPIENKRVNFYIDGD